MTTKRARFLYHNFYQLFRFAYNSSNTTDKNMRLNHAVKMSSDIQIGNRFTMAEKSIALNAWYSFCAKDK